MTHGHSLDPFRGFFYVSESVGFTTNSRRLCDRAVGLEPPFAGWLGFRGFFYVSESVGFTTNSRRLCDRAVGLEPPFAGWLGFRGFFYVSESWD